MKRFTFYETLDCDNGTQFHFNFDGFDNRYRNHTECAEWCRDTFGSEYVLNRRWWRAGLLIILYSAHDAFHFKMRWG